MLVVKTHRCDSRELPDDIQEGTEVKMFDRAVVLVRNPFDALVSEANRRWNSRKNVDSHVGLANEKTFIGNRMKCTILLLYIDAQQFSS